MKLYVAERSAGVPGGKAYMLVDAEGKTLPCQTAVSIKQQHDELTQVTVTFSVNGADVNIGEPPSERT